MRTENGGFKQGALGEGLATGDVAGGGAAATPPTPGTLKEVGIKGRRACAAKERLLTNRGTTSGAISGCVSGTPAGTVHCARTASGGIAAPIESGCDCLWWLRRGLGWREGRLFSRLSDPLAWSRAQCQISVRARGVDKRDSATSRRRSVRQDDRRRTTRAAGMDTCWR